MKRMLIISVIVFVSLVLLIVVTEILIVRFNGKSVPTPDIPRETQLFGDQGSSLVYVVMGDSTTVSQGSDYEQGYAVKSAEHLAIDRKVELTNFGVSGARVKDVLNDQLSKALEKNPDIILISVGANDVTHLTNLSSFEQDLDKAVSTIKNESKDTKIVVTGSPDMGTVARFPWFTKKLASARTNQINAVYDEIISRYSLTHAPIAERTGPIFAKDKSLYSIDKFHPNATGYAVWVTVINEALDSVLKQ